MNAYVTSGRRQALVLPCRKINLASPIEGPAKLKPVEVIATPQTVHGFGTQISLLRQNFSREFGATPEEAKAKVVKIDNYQVVEKGTNSVGSKMYDVAACRPGMVTPQSPTGYLSQSSAAVTVTGHCGLGMFIERMASR